MYTDFMNERKTNIKTQLRAMRQYSDQKMVRGSPERQMTMVRGSPERQRGSSQAITPQIRVSPERQIIHRSPTLNSTSQRGSPKRRLTTTNLAGSPLKTESNFRERTP